jgi:hypothetical protein
MKEYDLEQELLESEIIVANCKNSVSYCKALYSALCNTEWQKCETWPVLKDEKWSCSWRYAGGIIARIIEDGDYLDWYCSGNEGLVIDYIEEDLKSIGWVCIEDYDNQII